MALTVLPTDLQVQGNLSASTMTLPAASVGDAQATTGSPITAAKLQHQYEKIAQPQDSTTNAAVSRKVIHVVKGATATIVSFDVGAVTAATVDATTTIDLKKNGSSILTGAVSLTASTAAFALLAGSLASSSLVAGDVLEFHITAATVAAGALAKGVFGRLVIREDAQ